MKGMENLIRMRLNGRVPAVLWVDLDIERLPSEGHLHIGHSESISSLDLRAVQGMVLAVSGIDSGRVKSISSALKAAGARRVISTVSRRFGEGEFLVTEVTDTEGVLEWKS